MILYILNIIVIPKSIKVVVIKTIPIPSIPSSYYLTQFSAHL